MNEESMIQRICKEFSDSFFLFALLGFYLGNVFWLGVFGYQLDI